MNIKFNIKLTIILITTILIFSCLNFSCAIEPIEDPSRPRQTPSSEASGASTLDSIADGANSFLEKGKNSGQSIMNSSGIKEASDTIYNILLGAGILIVLVIGSVLGIKFMLSSAEDKAKLKEALIPYIVGSIIIFGAFGIWKIVITLGRNFDNTGNSSGVTTSIEEE